MNFPDNGDVDRAMIDPRLDDPAAELVQREGMSDRDIDEVVEVMAALREWHRAAERMSASSRRYMKLNETDMRAIRFLIAVEHAGGHATARALADHLGISSAATTKMLDRLEHGRNVSRAPHPRDRRALTVRVTPGTRAVARESVGRVHARRFGVAARLTAEQRTVVAGFLRALAATERSPDVVSGSASDRF